MDRKIDSLDKSDEIRQSFRAAHQKINLLNDTKALNFIEFYSYMQDPGVDKAVYVYNSSAPINDTFMKRAAMFNFLAEANRNNLNNHDLLFASYDVARVRLDDRFERDPRFSLDSLYVIRADQPDGPFAKYQGGDEQWTASELTIFIEDNRQFRYEPVTDEEKAAFDSLLRPIDNNYSAAPPDDDRLPYDDADL